MSENRSFDVLMAQFTSFSLKTFEDATASSSLEKLEDEIKEVRAAFDNDTRMGLNKLNLAKEYADCIMCLLDSAARKGLSIAELKSAFDMKLTINMSRKWVKNDNNTYSHVQ